MEKQFYTYLYLREDGSPYYAGKGCGVRAYHGSGHRIKPPKDKTLIIIFPMLNETEAFESEKALIELFGRKNIGTGILRNFTNGGEGMSGYVFSESTRRKQSEAHKNPSEETRRKMSLASSMRTHSIETRRKMSEIAKNKPKSETHCRNLSKALRGRILTKEHRENIGKGGIGRVFSAEARRKISIARLAYWARVRASNAK